MRHQIQGQVDHRFERVLNAFHDNFDCRGEIGASLCVWHKGTQVVDLWGGYQDLEGEIPWQADTLTTIFSCTKGIAAACLLMLVARGQLDYDAPISSYWPDFAKGPEPPPPVSAVQFTSRANLTVRALLNHRSGLLGLTDPMTREELEDDAKLATRLEQLPFAWHPGEKQGYHGVTFGMYARILFKKITGESIGQFFKREISDRFDVDVHLGLPETSAHRVAPIYPNTTRDILWGVLPNLLLRRTREGRIFRAALKSNGYTKLAFRHPEILGARQLRNFNTSRARTIELPWANAQASARGLAQFYKTLIAPNQLVAPKYLIPIHERQSWVDRDEVLRKPMGFSQGFIKEELHLFSPNRESFGHPGAGGALGLADPKEGLVIAYVMNRMGYHIRSPRALALCKAVYTSLGYPHC